MGNFKKFEPFVNATVMKNGPKWPIWWLTVRVKVKKTQREQIRSWLI